MLRKLIIGLISLLFSALLIFSIPLLNYLMSDRGSQEDQIRKTEVSIKRAPPPEQKEKKQKPTRRPERSKPSHRNVKSGPRFAMDLSVGGTGQGVGVDMKLAGNSGGSGMDGDVDERPRQQGRPNFQAPRAILEAEVNATLRMSFCVDASGQVFDIKILEETPSGMGLGDAGRGALQSSRFEPASKDGQSVPFCGMEQPFEIRFRG